MQPKRIKSGKDKWKYKTQDGLVLTLTQLRQLKSWYDTTTKTKHEKSFFRKTKI